MTNLWCIFLPLVPCLIPFFVLHPCLISLSSFYFWNKCQTSSWISYILSLFLPFLCTLSFPRALDFNLNIPSMSSASKQPIPHSPIPHGSQSFHLCLLQKLIHTNPSISATKSGRLLVLLTSSLDSQSSSWDVSEYRQIFGSMIHSTNICWLATESIKAHHIGGLSNKKKLY